MNKQHRLFRAWLAVLTLLTGLTASAMAAGATEYHCNGDGVSWTSRYPCPGTAPRSELRGLGNGQHTSTYQPSYIPSVGKAPDYLQYLSDECARLNDAIRTGPARGLKSGPMSDLYADYRKRCSDDESLARKQLREAERQQKEQRRDQQSAVKADKSRELVSAEQCYEMLRILHGKRQRSASMGDGEKADLQRFEDNYKDRCPRG